MESTSVRQTRNMIRELLAMELHVRSLSEEGWLEMDPRERMKFRNQADLIADGYGLNEL